jgi:hypothetical protein
LPYAKWQKLVECATTKQLQPKTCQKPYAKTPQKTHKNPAKILYRQKSFMISLTKNLLKTLNISKNFLILHFTNKTKNPCTN